MEVPLKSVKVQAYLPKDQFLGANGTHSVGQEVAKDNMILPVNLLAPLFLHFHDTVYQISLAGLIYTLLSRETPLDEMLHYHG